jgi:hypothetical protein
MQLSETQIQFIENDIAARGIAMESLQQELLDHICCILEQRNGEPFETAYASVIRSFYKKELKEIETETILLQNHKNYYAMKKGLIYSGIASALLLVAGIVFKFLYLPGASALIVSAIFIFCFAFIPLLSILRAKEKQTSREKSIVAFAGIAVFLLSLSFVFRVQHWMGAMIMFYLGIGILALLFLPLYLISGLKNPETKFNTLITSVLIVAGCGLWLTLVASPAGMRKQDAKITHAFLRNEFILQNEKRTTPAMRSNDATIVAGRRIYNDCELFKSLIFEIETGSKNLESNKVVMEDKWLQSYLYDHPTVDKQFQLLKSEIEGYNNRLASQGTGLFQVLPVTASILAGEERVFGAMNDILQVQMILLQNERDFSASVHPGT